MQATAGDKFWREGHGESRTQIEAGCLILPSGVKRVTRQLILPSGVKQVARQQYQTRSSDRPEGAYSWCHL